MPVKTRLLQGIRPVRSHLDALRGQDVLITLRCGRSVLARYLTVLHEVELTVAEGPGREPLPAASGGCEQPPWALTLLGETVETASHLVPSSVTFPVDDPGRLEGTVVGDCLSLWAGGPWLLAVHRLHEPLRHRTDVLLEKVPLRPAPPGPAPGPGSGRPGRPGPS